MFDVSWSELLVVAVVALLVVGPKELPALLRTVGKYLGMVKRQAAEFRAQFDEAMRETELDQLKKDVESIKSEAESTLREAERSVDTEMADAKREFDKAAEPISTPPAELTAEPPPKQIADAPELAEANAPAPPAPAEPARKAGE